VNESRKNVNESRKNVNESRKTPQKTLIWRGFVKVIVLIVPIRL